LVNRTAVGANPKNNMKPTEDFLNVVMCAHVSAAAKQLMTAATDDCNVIGTDCQPFCEDIVI